MTTYASRVGRVNGKGELVAAAEGGSGFPRWTNLGAGRRGFRCCDDLTTRVIRAGYRVVPTRLLGLPSAIDSEQPVAIMAFNLCEPGMPERIELILKRIIEILRLSPCFSGDVRKAL